MELIWHFSVVYSLFIIKLVKLPQQIVIWPCWSEYLLDELVFILFVNICNWQKRWIEYNEMINIAWVIIFSIRYERLQELNTSVINEVFDYANREFCPKSHDVDVILNCLLIVRASFPTLLNRSTCSCVDNVHNLVTCSIFIRMLSLSILLCSNNFTTNL